MKTFLMKKQDVKRKWWLIDADGAILGRMSVKIAALLMGKHEPTWTPHVDCGDYVVVINAEKVRVTGNKAQQREYDYFTHYPGGHRYTSLAEMLATKPEKAIEMSVKRMMSKNKLARRMILRLKMVRGAEHKFQAHNPQVVKI